MQAMLAWLLALGSLFGCDGKDGGDDDSRVDARIAGACTPDSEGVQGIGLDVTPVYVSSLDASDCRNAILVNEGDVMNAFPNGSAPPLVAQTDFKVDRVVLASSNPIVRFVIDDGASILVGEEPLCQGEAPSCMAYIIHSTTRNRLEVAACPYRGPTPCTAP